MKYIHLSCLKQWISTKFYIKKDSNSYCITYLIKKAECELCKSLFPDYASHNKKLYDIKNIETYFSNYLILESITLDINKYKVMYIISLDNIEYPIKIGRAKESNVLISDISVSRFHCQIIIDNNKNIYIEDNSSKFGTLILIQTPKIILCDNLSLNIQVGRSFITCKIKQSFNIFKCCRAEEKPDVYYYYKQNTNKEVISKATIKTEVCSTDNDNSEEKEKEKIENKITCRSCENDDKDLNDKKENENVIQIEKENSEIKIYDENKSDIQIECIDKSDDNVILQNNNDNSKENDNDINNNNYEASFEEENISDSDLKLLSKTPNKPHL
jgi:hypothetical protein